MYKDNACTTRIYSASDVLIYTMPAIENTVNNYNAGRCVTLGIPPKLQARIRWTSQWRLPETQEKETKRLWQKQIFENLRGIRSHSYVTTSVAFVLSKIRESCESVWPYNKNNKTGVNQCFWHRHSKGQRTAKFREIWFLRSGQTVALATVLYQTYQFPIDYLSHTPFLLEIHVFLQHLMIHPFPIA